MSVTHCCILVAFLLVSVATPAAADAADQEKAIEAAIVAATSRYLTDKGDSEEERAHYQQALAYYQKALAVVDKAAAPKLWTALAMNVARMHKELAQWKEAEPLCAEILRLRESAFGKDAHETADALNNLAFLLQATDRGKEAESLYRRALAIDEASFGPGRPEVATRLDNLAGLLQDTNRLEAAESLYRRALAIDEASFGPDRPEVATRLNNLADFLQYTDRLGEAEALMWRGLEILVSSTVNTGRLHRHLMVAINNYSGLLTEMGKTKAQVEEKIGEITEPVAHLLSNDGNTKGK